ncbi:MAG: hypothetical protein H7338_10185 [Candidatus Sericytochromatia bacterium]|nr:hypothetical protein [Candidatus Sericytochromatia bacterium]
MFSKASHFALTGLVVGGLMLGTSGCGLEPGLTARAAGIAGRPAEVIANQASRQALKWAGDSFLIAADGYNLDANSRLRNTAYSRWDFTYVSATKVGTLVITVPGQGKITSTPTAPVSNAYQPLMIGGNWKIDSDKAAGVARKALGSTAPDDRIDRISLVRGTWGAHLPQIAWQISADLGQRMIVVDAQNGKLIAQ